MADRLLGILGDKALEFSFGFLMLKVSVSGPSKYPGEFRPCIGRAHVDDPDRFDGRPGRLDSKQTREFTALDATPEFLFCGQKQVLVEGIG
jgi:hypothetical protein